MMDVFWLQQNQADVSPQDHWLSETETALLDEMRFLKRRADWRLGRWTAKNALAARLNLPARAFSSLEIRPAKSGAPQAYFLDKLCPVSISLSHRDGKAVCVLADARTPLRQLRRGLLDPRRAGVDFTCSWSRPRGTDHAAVEREGEHSQSPGDWAPSRHSQRSRRTVFQ